MTAALTRGTPAAASRALAVVALVVVGAADAAAQAARPSRPLPSPLRLADVIALARSQRDEIAAARARARAAAERPAIVSALEDPVLSPSIDHLPFELHGVDWSVTIEQSFPLSRVRGNRGRVAEAEARRLRADVDRIALDVELDAAGAFLMLRERRRTAAILAERAALADQVVAAAAARYAAGTGNQADVLRAELEVARLRGATAAIAAELRAAEAMLNASLGRAIDAAIPPLAQELPTAEPPSAEAIAAAALARRPELAGGQAEVGRATSEVAAMRSMYGPMAMIRTGPAYTMVDGPGWMVMLGVSIPLGRGRLRAGVAEAEAMVDMARADLAAMRTMIEGEAVVARERVAAARARVIALRDDVLPRAHQTVAPILASYGAGQQPLVAVLEAIQALWAVETELVEAELELGVAWARLDRAIGGGAWRR